MPIDVPSTMKRMLNPATKSSAWGRTAARAVIALDEPVSAAAPPRKARYTGSSASTQGEMKLRAPAATATAMLTSVIGLRA